MEKTIEIPFGAKDSELKGWEYTIPEDMEAEIKDGKIIVKQKENEDEKTRQELLSFIRAEKKYTPETVPGEHWDRWIAYLERQKEQQPAEWSEEVMTMCNQILIDWVKEGKTPEEREQREQAHIRFFELYDEYMQEQPEVDLDYLKNKAELIANGIMIGVQANKYHTCIYDKASNDFNHSHLVRAALKGIEFGLNARKEE